MRVKESEVQNVQFEPTWYLGIIKPIELFVMSLK